MNLHLWRAWSFEPGVVLALGFPAVLYALGARIGRGVTRGQMLCFWSGMAILALALLSPLHALGGLLFSAHMMQHELLIMAAAPLLVLSRPLVPFLWAFPLESRRALGRYANARAVQAVWRGITKPAAAWSLHAAALWAWHAPALFSATLRYEWVHTAQHLSFFGTALLFWWPLVYHRGSGVLYIFTTAVHTSILGALLTFAPVVLYPAYAVTAPAWGLTGLEDQQIGGLIMWVPAGVVYMAAGLALFSAWLRESKPMTTERRYAD